MRQTFVAFNRNSVVVFLVVGNILIFRNFDSILGNQGWQFYYWVFWRQTFYSFTFFFYLYLLASTLFFIYLWRSFLSFFTSRFHFVSSLFFSFFLSFLFARRLSRYRMQNAFRMSLLTHMHRKCMSKACEFELFSVCCFAFDNSNVFFIFYILFATACLLQ